MELPLGNVKAKYFYFVLLALLILRRSQILGAPVKNSEGQKGPYVTYNDAQASDTYDAANHYSWTQGQFEAMPVEEQQQHLTEPYKCDDQIFVEDFWMKDSERHQKSYHERCTKKALQLGRPPPSMRPLTTRRGLHPGETWASIRFKIVEGKARRQRKYLKNQLRKEAQAAVQGKALSASESSSTNWQQQAATAAPGPNSEWWQSHSATQYGTESMAASTERLGQLNLYQEAKAPAQTTGGSSATKSFRLFGQMIEAKKPKRKG